MPRISVRRQHAFGLAKAKDLARSIARRLKDDYGGSFGWQGDVLHFERPGASGSVAVTKDDFRVHVDLGVLLSPLRSRIEREIVKFFDEHVAAGDEPARPQTPRPARRRGDSKHS